MGFEVFDKELLDSEADSVFVGGSDTSSFVPTHELAEAFSQLHNEESTGRGKEDPSFENLDPNEGANVGLGFMSPSLAPDPELEEVRRELSEMEQEIGVKR